MIGDKGGNYARAQNAYHDFQGLRELKQGAIQDDPEALKEVARQFEALFIQMIMKSAREADELIAGEDSLLNSKELSFFQGMLDEQFSIAMTQANGGKGMGLADVLVSQLSRARPEAQPEVPDEVRRGAQLLTEDVMRQLNERRLRFSRAPLADAANAVPVAADAQQQQDRRAAAEAVQAARRPPMAAAAELAGRKPLEIQGLPVREDKRAYFESPEDFVRHLYPLAQQAAARLGVDPRLMLAQSALETGWGRFMIPREDGTNSFNLFGIKADRRWDGDSAEVQTLEYRNGQPRQERWPFRAYESFEQAMHDYVDFLTANPRYRQALDKVDNPQAFARGLQQAGYATDPRYANKIINIMDGSTLNQAIENLQQEQLQAETNGKAADKE
ncbi:flagellar assembly peptidoglycan hydrolase FlgJ [Marinospirillum alkaliphilum]|uniref:Peptidoglycan hydrolase FlgJ n=1 Tax=Marinospirillum alkaliphilum DSM 21637 TaxID=1122209 RepID=A0A1K1V0L8_9GAMM|nr:flagellar assembly peptidoglycan hydrolase FlgJ [Marinospirillum alkaliphilum]SFX18332.1 flagellar protein FlgJ [Marinospirillum alkaliphilum DSM 21637]